MFLKTFVSGTHQGNRKQANHRTLLAIKDANNQYYNLNILKHIGEVGHIWDSLYRISFTCLNLASVLGNQLGVIKSAWICEADRSELKSVSFLDHPDKLTIFSESHFLYRRVILTVFWWMSHMLSFMCLLELYANSLHPENRVWKLNEVV